MGPHNWWSLVVIVLAVAAPWLAAIAWVVHVTPRGDGAPPPSWGSYLRQRASVR
jgi:hypothetical protein